MKIRGDNVISLTQAKSLLGDEADMMTDDEIQQLIDDFDMIAQFSIQMVLKFRDENEIQMK